MQREFKVSLSPQYYSEVIRLSQYDTNYPLIITVLDKTARASINGMSAYFEGTRSDGMSFRYSGTAVGSKIQFTIDTALTAVAGKHTGEVVLYDGSVLWFGSANVQILVEKAARPDNAIDADVTSQQTLLEQITSLAEQTEESADGIINMTVSAQTLAQGAEATVTKTEQGGVVNLEFGLPLADGEVQVVNVSGANPTITAENNKRYVCGEVSTLTITPVSSGITDVRFTSGTTATVLSLPQTVKMPEWFSVEASKTYELSIMDGVYGTVMAWT